MTKKRSRGSDPVGKLFDVLDAAERGIDSAQRIIGKVGKIKDNIVEMLGDNYIPMSEYERALDADIAELQAQVDKVRAQRQASGFTCPHCGGPHKAYECEGTPASRARPSPEQKHPAGASQTIMTVERAMDIMSLSDSDMNKSPKEFHSLIRQRYRELAMIWHPDTGGTETRMKELNAAYFFLRERVERYKPKVKKGVR